MAIFKKENVILRESDNGRIKELLVRGFEEVKEEDLKPKKAAKKEGKEGK